MSEYWVSHKKYFCKYCDIYISDDAPSRQQHENGLRHKGNTDRFIRGLYKAGEKRKKDLDEEKRDMARIEQAAQAAFAQDVGAGHAKASSSSKLAPSAPPVARKPPQKPTNAFSNYSTAESLGYKDPDADRLLAETQRRRTQGVAGDWEIVTPSPADPTSISTVADEDMSRKREAEDMHDDGRQFKLRKKTLMTGLGEIYDPGIIPIKMKEAEEQPATEVDNLVFKGQSDVTAPPKWTTLHWKRSGDGDEKEIKQEAEGSACSRQEMQGEPPEQQSASSQTATEDKIPVKVESAGMLSEEAPSAPSANAPEEAGSLFRKRKTPGISGRGRRPV